MWGDPPPAPPGNNPYIRGTPATFKRQKDRKLKYNFKASRYNPRDLKSPLGIFIPLHTLNTLPPLYGAHSACMRVLGFKGAVGGDGVGLGQHHTPHRRRAGWGLGVLGVGYPLPHVNPLYGVPVGWLGGAGRCDTYRLSQVQ